MKTKLFLLAMVTIALAGCTDDLERRGSYSPEGGLQATIPAYPFDGGTRVSITSKPSISACLANEPTKSSAS